MKYPKLELIGKDKKAGQISINDIVDMGAGKITFYMRCAGELQNKAIFLSSYFDWQIVKDSEDHICLVPLKKDTS